MYIIINVSMQCFKGLNEDHNVSLSPSSTLTDFILHSADPYAVTRATRYLHKEPIVADQMHV